MLYRPSVSSQLYGPAGGVEHRLLGVHVLRGVLGQDRRPSSAFVPSSLTTMGSVIPVRSIAERSPRATSSPRVMPPKMLNKHALDLLVGGDDVEGRRDLLRVGPAADVAEVGGLAAGLGHHVERAHHEPRPVAQDAHVAVELDVLQADLLRPLLLRVGGLNVVQLGYVLVPVQAGVVHRYLGVERQDAPVLRERRAG